MMSQRKSAEELQATLDAFMDKLNAQNCLNNFIEPELYNKFNVKRGLRNADGSGVLVGLTEIGEVHAYIMEENEKLPVPGRLRYRGIDINDFVKGYQKEKRFGFEECCYLLLVGELPTEEQLAMFKELLASRRELPSGFTEDSILKMPSQDIMNKLSRSILTLYSFDEKADDTSVKNVFSQCLNLIAQVPTIAAYAYQAKKHYFDGESLFIHSPQPNLSTAENLLYMIRPDHTFTPLEAEVLDLNLVLHAEHGGGNNSTFAVHVVTTSGTDTYSAISTGINSLKGPKHGGANRQVMEMMDNIKANIKNWEDEAEVFEYLCKILRKEAHDGTGLIYGIGHAVYTISDPRAVLLKEKAEELAKASGNEKEFNLYNLIERLAPQAFAEVKKSDKIVSANVDFYSGFVYQMLGIPKELYTPIFAIARMAGWSAHRIEELINGNRIIRPAYKNVLPKTKYQPLEER